MVSSKGFTAPTTSDGINLRTVRRAPTVHAPSGHRGERMLSMLANGADHAGRRR
jgi:hypothetical protein